MEQTRYETGRLGMSSPEIEEEMEAIRRAVMSRDSDAMRHGVAYFHLHTPQEVHRVAVLNAMRMAISCLVYRDLAGWLNRKAAYTRPYETPCRVSDAKYLGTQEQRDAHALSDHELNLVWAAQSKRVGQAKVVENVVPDSEDGGPIHGVLW